MYDSPPAQAAALPTAESRWPGVIGTISIVYGIVGMGCGFCGSGGFALQIAQAMTFDITTPPVLIAVTSFNLFVMFMLGIYLLTGGIGLTRRSRKGLARVRRWAMIRLVWAVISLGIGIALLGTTVDWSMAIQEAAAEQAQQQGAPSFAMDERMTTTMTLASTAIMAIIASIYPLFLMLFLSRDRVTEEAAEWI